MNYLKQLAEHGYQLIMFSTVFREACKVDVGSSVINLQPETVSDDLLLLPDGKRLVEGILFKRHWHYLQLQRELADENPIFCLDRGRLYVIKWHAYQSSSSERLFIWVDAQHRGMVLLYHHTGECHQVFGPSSYHSLLKERISRLTQDLTDMQDQLKSLPVDGQDQSTMVQVESSGSSSEVGELSKVDTEQQFNRWLHLGAMDEYSPKKLLELCCVDINVAYEKKPINGVLLRRRWMQCMARCMQDNPDHKLKLEGHELMWGQHKVGKLPLGVRRWLCEQSTELVEQSPLSLPLFQLLVVFDSYKAVEHLFIHHELLLNGVVNSHVWADVHALLRSCLGSEDVLDATQQRWIQLVLTYESLQRLCSVGDWGRLLSWVEQESMLESINVHDETQADQWFQCMTNVVFLQDFKIRNQWLTWYCTHFIDGFDNLCQALVYGDALTHLILWYKFQKLPNSKWVDTIKNLQANKLLTDDHERILGLSEAVTESDLPRSEPPSRYPVEIYDAAERLRDVKKQLDNLDKTITNFKLLNQKQREQKMSATKRIRLFTSTVGELINPIIRGLSIKQWGHATAMVRQRLFDCLSCPTYDASMTPQSTDPIEYCCLALICNAKTKTQLNLIDLFQQLFPLMTPKLSWVVCRWALLCNKMEIFDCLVDHDPDVVSRSYAFADTQEPLPLLFSLVDVPASDFTGRYQEVITRLVDRHASLWTPNWLLTNFTKLKSNQPTHLMHYILNKPVDHDWLLSLCRAQGLSYESLSLKTTYDIDLSYYDLVIYYDWQMSSRHGVRSLIDDMNRVGLISNHRYDSLESAQIKQMQRIKCKKTVDPFFRGHITSGQCERNPSKRLQLWIAGVLNPVLTLLSSMPQTMDELKCRLCHIINRSKFGLNEPAPLTLLYLAVKYGWDNHIKTALLDLGADPNVANRLEGDLSDAFSSLSGQFQSSDANESVFSMQSLFTQPWIESVSLSDANEVNVEQVSMGDLDDAIVERLYGKKQQLTSPYMTNIHGKMVLLEDGATPLHIAAYQLDTKAMEWLITNGADQTKTTLPEARVTGVIYYNAQRVLHERLIQLDKSDPRYSPCLKLLKQWIGLAPVKKQSSALRGGFFSSVSSTIDSSRSMDAK